jgi:NTF2-like N-terminal transpeptidase domain./Penicillin-binding Protein dimerisation domain./Penicillin binding protein transpeptidase domain.
VKKGRPIAWLSWMLVFIFLLAGCKKEETGPDDVFAEYVKLWNKQDFSSMYEMLADDVKKEISKDEFVGRYEKIYGDLEVSELKVSFKKPKETEPENGKIQFPFKVSMNTVAGPIRFDQQAVLKEVQMEDEKTAWKVEWNPGFIFAGMDWGDKIGFHSEQAERGEIVDRNGKGLAVNGEVYEVGIVPSQMEGKEEEVKKAVADLLGISVGTIDKALSADWVQPDHYVPLRKFSGDNEALKIQLEQIPGVQIRKTKARVYPLKEAAAHLIGYVGAVTAEDLEKHKGYSATDVIGKRGLEQVLEDRLKGENGIQITIQKPAGEEMILAEKPVRHGETVRLTIDSDMQKLLYDKFEGKAGTAAAIDPETGETLALVSSPGFDPNEFIFGITNEAYASLEQDPLQPLLNRFSAIHTPGSVMKPLVAAVGLETKAIDGETAMDIRGKKWQKDDSWGGYSVTRVSDPGHPVNLTEALVLSDNIYFAKTALAIGKDNFIQGLKNLGFGEEIPFTYPMKASQVSNDGTIDGDIQLADSGYGQGEVQVNIIHLLSAYSAFINGGNMIKPVLLGEESAGEYWKEGIIKKETAETVAQALQQVVENPAGTAHSAKMSDLPLAGKTGTAEMAKSSQGGKGTANGWFVAYRTDTKDLMIGMMMEGIQDEGSKLVVEKVKQAFAEWYTRD